VHLLVFNKFYIVTDVWCTDVSH